MPRCLASRPCGISSGLQERGVILLRNAGGTLHVVCAINSNKCVTERVDLGRRVAVAVYLSI